MKKIVLFIFSIVIVASILWVYINFCGPGVSEEKERFVIRPDTKEEQIVNDLVSKGFLKKKSFFNFILTIKGWHGKIEPGGYLLPKNLNAYQLAQTLISGPYQKWVVIPSGRRKEQVALILKNSLNWPDHMVLTFILVAQEGYLYPDTYLVNTDADPQEVFQKLLSNFNEKFDAQIQKDLLEQNIRYDTAIKIASLIERESGGSEDKPIISGIIWNRLLKGMKLEIDATVQYAITSEKLKANKQSLFLVETQNSEKLWIDFNFWPILGSGVVRTIDSLYNTYLNKGLPPGPICSPSIESIRAVAYPAETDALYYLHSPDKQIHTAKTYKEHQENIVKYLQ